MRYLHKYQDDPDVPESTSYYYGTGQAYMNIFGGITFIIIGIYLIINTLGHSKNFVEYFQYLFAPIGLYTFIKGIINLENRTPQITLSEDGILTPEAGLICWDDIDDATISIYGEDLRFVYTSKGKKKQFDLGVYDMKEEELQHLLKVYLIRYQEKQYLIIP